MFTFTPPAFQVPSRRVRHSVRSLLGALCAWAVLLSCAQAADPVQEKGVTLKFSPGGLTQKAGYEVTRAGGEVAKPGQLVFENGTEVYAWCTKLPRDILRNGIWIITENPASYSQAQNDDFDTLKTELGRTNLALFICRDTELPGGWKPAE